MMHLEVNPNALVNPEWIVEQIACRPESIEEDTIQRLKCGR